MSAFIVSDKTINAIVTNCYNSNYSDKCKRNLAKQLFNLNRASINQRYGMGEDKKFREMDYEYKRHTVDKVTAFKALQCLIYQCSEGNVPETRLYKSLEKKEQKLAYEIVTNLPEYNKTSWDL